MHLSFIEKKNLQLINSTFMKQTYFQNNDPFHHHVFLRKAGIILQSNYQFVIFVNVLDFVILKIRFKLKTPHF